MAGFACRAIAPTTRRTQRSQIIMSRGGNLRRAEERWTLDSDSVRSLGPRLRAYTTKRSEIVSPSDHRTIHPFLKGKETCVLSCGGRLLNADNLCSDSSAECRAVLFDAILTVAR